MKKLIVATLVSLIGASAMAQMYPAPIPAPVYGGGYYGGGYYGGGYYQNQRTQQNEVGSILSAYTGALLLSSASMCGSGAGCMYKEVIMDSKDDAAIFISTEGAEKGVKLARALELLREMDPKTKLNDLQLAEEILNY
ncbi:MAG: DUF2388 domain-containing protein [Bdellovibrio sp.]|nr:DUF2388 domain-containing protein [Bdellovibrio sp.]